MAKEGWIKLHRKLLDNAIFYKPDYFQVWVYILLNVNFEDNTFIWNNEIKLVKKGSGIFSQKQIGQDLRINISTINRILNFLKNENQILFTGYSKHTEIEVIKWEDYQDAFENGNQTKTKLKPNQKQTKTIKNDKKEKNDKNIAYPSIEEVKEYFKSNNYSELSASKAFKYYSEANWVDSKGNKVLNWKQKMQAVWFKPENEIKKPVEIHGQKTMTMDEYHNLYNTPIK